MRRAIRAANAVASDDQTIRRLAALIEAIEGPGDDPDRGRQPVSASVANTPPTALRGHVTLLNESGEQV